MSWIEWLLAVVGATVVAAAALYLWARKASRREPYRTFVGLPTRSKIAFAKALVKDPRVPLWVKAIPFATALYLASPIDLIPDFIPVLGYLDDVAIVLLAVAAIVKFTPSDVITDLMNRAQREWPSA